MCSSDLAFAQPEDPGFQIFARLPTLGNTGNDVAFVIDVGEASIHHGRQMGAVKLIVTMPIEAGGIATRAVLQDAAALRMLLGGRRRMGKAQGRHAGERAARADLRPLHVDAGPRRGLVDVGGAGRRGVVAGELQVAQRAELVEDLVLLVAVVAALLATALTVALVGCSDTGASTASDSVNASASEDTADVPVQRLEFTYETPTVEIGRAHV